MTDIPGTQMTGTPVRRWLPVGRFSGLFSVRLGLRAIAHIRSADVVHVSIARDLVPLFATLVAIVMRKALILQPHGMLGSSNGRIARAFNPFLRIAIRRAACVICLTEREADELQEIYGPFRMVVLGNASPDRLLEIVPDRDGSEVLFMARLHPRKRPDVFVRAAAVSSHGEWHLVGPDDGCLTSLRELNVELGSPVEFYAPVPPDAVYDRLSQSSVFVLPASAEPWGNVLVAALTLGIPAVVSESTALAGQIVEAGAGISVPDDNAQAIATAVDDLLADSAYYQKVSDAARALARAAFVDSRLSGQLLDAYARAVAADREL